MKNLIMLISLSAIILSLTSCDNAARDASKCWDSSLPMEIAHGGEFKGYATVFTIDWVNESYDSSSESYKVYKKSNGDYVVNYNGKDCLLQSVSEPLTASMYSLKWKIDYNHYIEDIPTSW